MHTRQDHIDYIKTNGRFPVDGYEEILSPEEREALEKYGYWFLALTNGILEPITELQKRFIAVAHNQEDPFSIEEKAWFKYQGRKNLKKCRPEYFNIEYHPEEDIFFTRDDYKKLHSYYR
jgi:uncharacterized protein YifE (UPF0438 family)